MRRVILSAAEDLTPSVLPPDQNISAAPTSVFAFRGGPRGAAPFAFKGAGLDSTQPKINASCHPERGEGPQPQRLATRPKYLGSANVRVYPEGRALGLL